MSSLLLIAAVITFTFSHIGSASVFHRSDIQIPLISNPHEIFESSNTLRYAAFGDSWASGVNWGPPSEDLEYDFPDSDEVCRCRRVREAYPIQLLDDSDRSWTGGRTLELEFVACHGAHFESTRDQLTRLRHDFKPDFATLMIGGNPAGFPNIIEDCIYQFRRDKDYGPEFPDENGECAKTLQRAHETLNSLWFRRGLYDSITAITKDSRIRWNPRFRLYLLGYAKLFNHEDPKCNDWSFGIWPGKKPRLTVELRHAINEVLDHGRTVYDFIINHILFDPRVRFIDMNHIFTNHRFCEPTDSGTLDGQNENSWLYSFAWPSCIPLSEGNHLPNTTNETDPDQLAFCRNCGGLFELGELQRMFHPKSIGHEAYKNTLKDILRNDLNFIENILEPSHDPT
jgi:hypothetical protein